MLLATRLDCFVLAPRVDADAPGLILEAVGRLKQFLRNTVLLHPQDRQDT